MILGSYYLTMVRIGSAEKGAERMIIDNPGDTGFEAGAIVDGDELYQANVKAKKEGTAPATYKPTLMYRDSAEAIMAYNEHIIGVHQPVWIRVTKEVDGEKLSHVVRATAGRIIFNRNIPQDLGFVKRLSRRISAMLTAPIPSMPSTMRSASRSARSSSAISSTAASRSTASPFLRKSLTASRLWAISIPPRARSPYPSRI